MFGADTDQGESFSIKLYSFNRGNGNSIAATSQTLVRIERTLKVINQLAEDKEKEISDFADFIFKRYEDYQLTKGIQKIVSESQTFDFLNNEEDIYSLADLKEVYNG